MKKLQDKRKFSQCTFQPNVQDAPGLAQFEGNLSPQDTTQMKKIRTKAKRLLSPQNEYKESKWYSDRFDELEDGLRHPDAAEILAETAYPNGISKLLSSFNSLDIAKNRNDLNPSHISTEPSRSTDEDLKGMNLLKRFNNVKKLEEKKEYFYAQTCEEPSNQQFSYSDGNLDKPDSNENTVPKINELVVNTNRLFSSRSLEKISEKDETNNGFENDSEFDITTKTEDIDEVPTSILNVKKVEYGSWDENEVLNATDSLEFEADIEDFREFSVLQSSRQSSVQNKSETWRSVDSNSLHTQTLKVTKENKNGLYTGNKDSGAKEKARAVKVDQHFISDESSILPGSSQVSYDQEIMVNEEFVLMSVASETNN